MGDEFPPISLLIPDPDNRVGVRKGGETLIARAVVEIFTAVKPTEMEKFPVNSLFSGNSVEQGSPETPPTASQIKSPLMGAFNLTCAREPGENPSVRLGSGTRIA